MEDQKKTKDRLMAELAACRQRIAELESAARQAPNTQTTRVDSQAQYRELTESITDLFFAMDHELRYTYWNHASERFTGIAASDALGKSIYELFPEAQTAIAHYRTALEKQQPQRFFETYTNGEHTTAFDITVYPTTHGLTVYAKDQTSQRQVEATLQVSETRYRSLVENIPIGIYRNTPGPEGHSLMANPACVRLLGYDSPEDLAAIRIADLYADPTERNAFSERLIAQGSVTDFELRLKRKDGVTIWAAVTARVQRDAQGRVTHFDGTIEDISKRKRQEIELAALASVARTISSTLESQPLLENILQTARQVIPAAEKGSLALLIDDEHLQVRAISGYQDRTVLGMTYPITWGFSGRALRERRPLHINNIEKDAPLRADAASAPLAEVRALRSAIVMPLEVYGRAIGVISLESNSSAIAFQDEDLQLLGSLAGPIALAIANARLFEETRRRLNEIETLHQAGQRLLNTPLDPEAIYTAIHQAVAAVMPCEAFVIALENQDEYRARYVFDKGGRWPDRPIPHGQGLTWKVISSGETLLLNDLDAESATPAIHFGSPDHVRAVLAAPLHYGERIIGMISAQSYQPNTFNQQHRLLLETLAAQFAAIIENAALYQQMQSRLRELEIITRISAALRVAPNRAAILDAILNQLLTELQVEGASLERLDVATNAFYVEQAHGIWQPLTHTLIPPDVGRGAHVLSTGSPYLNNEAHLDPRLFRPDLFAGCRAIAAAPLMVEVQVPGLLWIASRRALTEDDLRLLIAVANIAANALHRAALQDKMIAQARQMTQLVDSVPEGMILLNTDGYVLLANPVARQILAVLTDTHSYLHIHSLGGRPLAEWLTSPPKGLWHEIRTPTHVFELIARPIVNGPNPEHWVLVIKDVTQERQIRDLRQRQERLAAVGQLAAGIAHDFNNIMAVIVLYTHMALRTSSLSAHDRERLNTVMDQAHRATELIQQILDFGRQVIIEQHPMDLTAFTKEHVKLLERILPENISILLVCAQEQVTINADPTRIQQLLTNLAINARDAMPDGGVLTISLQQRRVRAEAAPVLPDLPPGDWVILTVTDTGTGIPPDVLPHIFEPFFTTKDPGKGSGLGLAQVYGIVEQHEGRITVGNVPGGGASFTIYLPAWEGAAIADEIPDLSTQPLGQGETILIVEDNAVLRAAMAENLKHLNYYVLETANGREALTLLEARKGDVALVLSDIVMPFMGGQALLHAVRAQGWRMPFILISGHPIEKELDALLDQGLNCWLRKPLGLERLAQTVANVLHGDSCQEP